MSCSQLCRLGSHCFKQYLLMGRGIMIGQLAQPPPIRVGCGRVLVSNNNMEREGGNSSVGCRLLCVCHGLLRSRQITNPRNFMCKPASLHPPHHSRQAQLLVPGHRGSHPLAWIRYSRSHEGTSAVPALHTSKVKFVSSHGKLIGGDAAY